MSKKPTLYLEAMVFAPQHMSGIGHATLEITKELMRIQKESDKFNLVLLVPFNKVASVLQKFDDGAKPQIKKLWLPPRVIELLMRLNLLPPVDLFIGKGTYIFPNYRNWPVTRSKSVTYIHDISFKLFPEFASPKLERYLNKYIHRWLKRTDKVITLSEQVKSEILANFDVVDDKVTAIYDGVDTNLFVRRDSTQIEEMKKKYAIGADNYVLFVGNKEPRKNLQRLVEAFDKLDEELKDKYALVLVGGGGWLSQDIDNAIELAIANGAKIVSPSHFVEDADLPALYSGASLCAFVPVYEGFGIPPLESLACGTNVLASDIPVLKEVLQDQATYCDPLDVNSIKAGLEKNLRQPAGTYQNQAFLEQYSWKKCAEKLTETIFRL